MDDSPPNSIATRIQRVSDKVKREARHVDGINLFAVNQRALLNLKATANVESPIFALKILNRFLFLFVLLFSSLPFPPLRSLFAARSYFYPDVSVPRVRFCDATRHARAFDAVKRKLRTFTGAKRRNFSSKIVRLRDKVDVGFRGTVGVALWRGTEQTGNEIFVTFVARTCAWSVRRTRSSATSVFLDFARIGASRREHRRRRADA